MTIKDFWKQLFHKDAESPDILNQTPQRDKHIRRFSRTPLLIAGTAGLAVAGCMTYTFAQKSAPPSSNLQTAAPATAQTDDSHDKISFLENKQKKGHIGSETNLMATADDTTPANDPSLPQQADPLNTQPAQQQASMNPYQEARFQQWQQHEQQQQQLEDDRRNALIQSLHADTTVYSRNNEPPAATLTGAVQKEASVFDKLNASNPSAPEPENYLLHTRTTSVSPYEIKAGTVIPSVMIGGINSDLPGQIMAQVAQNVYDTATGQYLLVPQGTKIIGAYDHQVQNGQRRVLVVWNRLIYPDATSVTLGEMAGTDASGYAGFSDKTNTHIWPTMRNALFLSAITAGAQLSQPRATRGDFSYSSPQIAAASLGQQMNQLGMQSVSRDLNRPPTLTIRPGYVFNVMVNKDVILPPWHGRGHA